MYYDKFGNKITLEEFSRLIVDNDYKIIQQEQIGEYWVSTVWLGLNHGWPEENIKIFETMIFEGADKKEVFCERYSTLDEAIYRHNQLIDSMRLIILIGADRVNSHKSENS